MEADFSDDVDAHFNISDLIGDNCDVGDELMSFMETVLTEESNLSLDDSFVVEESSPTISDVDLRMLIDELKSTHTAKSMVFTTAQDSFFYNTDLWRSFYVMEKVNVDNCLLSRITQLSTRTKKLTELDYQLFLLFTKKCDNISDKSAMYLLCSEFIKLTHKFCHSPAFVNNVPTLVSELFNGEVQFIMTEVELEVIFYISGWTIHAMAISSLR